MARFVYFSHIPYTFRIGANSLFYGESKKQSTHNPPNCVLRFNIIAIKIKVVHNRFEQALQMNAQTTDKNIRSVSILSQSNANKRHSHKQTKVCKILMLV